MQSSLVLRSFLLFQACLVTSLSFAQEAVVTPAPALEAAPTSHSSGLANIGLRLDCLHNFNQDKGSTQQCISITGLRYTYTDKLSPKLSARVRLDPFGTPESSRENSPDRASLPTVRDSDFLIVDDYALIWSPRPNLEVAIEDYGGAATIPSTSGLALASPFSDTGWDQTALTVTYNLPALKDMQVKFAAGNGEGENGQNMDPQQYFGFQASAAIISGIKVNLGVSLDGNNIGSNQHTWEMQRYADRCGLATDKYESKLGYSMQRFGAGVELDGKLPSARGLKAGLGWQKSTAADLSKATDAGPSIAEVQGCRIDLDHVFVCDPTGETANSVERTVFGANVSYRILDRYFVALDYQNRQIDTGKAKLFAICNQYDGIECTESGDDVSKLTQTAYTVGGGIDLEEGLTLTFEYFKTELNEPYSKAYYVTRDDKPSEVLELFNARLSYNWK